MLWFVRGRGVDASAGAVVRQGVEGVDEGEVTEARPDILIPEAEATKERGCEGSGDPRHLTQPSKASASVRVFSSAAKEATAVADLLRRAHLFEGVPWSQMAVIVRSVSLSLPALRRAFRSAGVPLLTPDLRSSAPPSACGSRAATGNCGPSPHATIRGP